MLVLSRKVHEKIVVPCLNLVITVVAVKGKQVQLGFTAPAEVDINRGEVQQLLDARPRHRRKKGIRDHEPNADRRRAGAVARGR